MAIGRTNFPGRNNALGDIYITPNALPFYIGTTGQYVTPATSYCVNSGVYIYCPLAWVNYDSTLTMAMMYFSTDSSIAPTVVRQTSSLGYSSTLNSTYVNSGVIYFNYSAGYYTYYTISTNTWINSFYSGSHTSGTLINSDLTLNGFKYQPTIANGVTHTDYVITPLCRVTKL